MAASKFVARVADRYDNAGYRCNGHLEVYYNLIEHTAIRGGNCMFACYQKTGIKTVISPIRHKWKDLGTQIMTSKTFISSALWSILVICLLAVEVKSEEISSSSMSKLLTGYWVGQGDTTENPYIFHTVNCANGRVATAVIREGQDIFIYFGSWETDGASITHDVETSGTFDPESLDVLSMKDEQFSNHYHIIELTEALMIYEWRGQTTRRFEAQRADPNSGISNEGLNRLACDEQPSLS